MALHRAIIRQGISILDKQAIKTLRSFRFCIIKEGPDLPVFAHPSTLSRLGTWLVDAVRDLLEGSAAGKGRVKALPFILAALDEKRDAFLVVGITGAAEYGDVRKK
jgi:cell division control protein 45